MNAREGLAKLSLLALQKRREGLVKLLPPVAETLRGSLIERYLTCGNPDCKCARGERHEPVWYLSVTLDQSHRAGCTACVPLRRIGINGLAKSGAIASYQIAARSGHPLAYIRLAAIFYY